MEENIISTTTHPRKLGLVQGCISRMAAKSFAVKSWGVMLTLFTIFLAPHRTGYFDYGYISQYGDIVLLGLFVFWVIDAYYSVLERAYRKMYDSIYEKGAEDYASDYFRRDVGDYVTGTVLLSGISLTFLFYGFLFFLVSIGSV